MTDNELHRFLNELEKRLQTPVNAQYVSPNEVLVEIVTATGRDRYSVNVLTEEWIRWI